MNRLWLHYELTDFPTRPKGAGDDPVTARLRDELKSLLGAVAGHQEAFRGYLKFERNRSFELEGEVMLQVTPVGQIEEQLRSAKSALDRVGGGGEQADLLSVIRSYESVLDRVNSSVYAFLIETEAELEQGKDRASVFVRAQEYVVAALGTRAPKALEQILSAERLLDGGPEDLAHALTSCRRMLKSLADQLYPATNEVVEGNDGVQRKLSDDQYRNRLLEYVRATVSQRGQNSVLQKSLDSLGARLKTLDSLASKGVHDVVSAAEAETCVVWTYAIAADLLRVADGTSSLLPSDL